jgi:thioredoxin reductase
MRQTEVVIIGGGPAGLSAALVLGRCRRDVLVYDSGRYRNAPASRLKGFLTRDGIPPKELLALGRAELARYPSVALVSETIAEVRLAEDGFVAVTASGERVGCRALLLAAGFADALPPIEGARALHGRLVLPCPYCDAWELRDTPLGAFSHADDTGARFALGLAQWSRDVLYCAEAPPAPPAIDPSILAKLRERGVRIERRRPCRVEPDGDGVRLEFDEGAPVWRRALFYHLGGRPASELATRLGARLDERGGIEVDRKQASSVPGLYAAGDATRDVLQAIVAAGEGAAAAVSINEYLSCPVPA